MNEKIKKISPMTFRDRGEIPLPVICLSCSKEHIERPAQVCVHPNTAHCLDQVWDGVVFSHIVICPNCNAKDDYRLTPEAKKVLSMELKKASREGRLTDARSWIVRAYCRIWSGETIHRQSHGLRLLERQTKKHPTFGQAWRRLGNTERRLGLEKEAFVHFMKACEVDERELEAATCLSEMCWENGDFERTFHYLQMSLERLPKTDTGGEERETAAECITALLRVMTRHSADMAALVAVWEDPASTRDTPRVVASSVDLKRVRRWRGLVDLFNDPRLIGVSLVSDIPEEHPTILESRIAGVRHRPAGMRKTVLQPSSKKKAARRGKKKKRRRRR